ncbi:hypothetical protein B0H14DRAFT_2604234 [Mycena olivaceomarginata]|nr:hypothetical protein B0H14DRAFT_2604234 [Mycena olivaceomarginata]
MPRSDASRWLDQVKKTGKIIRPANLLNWVVTACYITRQRHHFPLVAPRTGSYKEEKVWESTMAKQKGGTSLKQRRHLQAMRDARGARLNAEKENEPITPASPAPLSPKSRAIQHHKSRADAAEAQNIHLKREHTKSARREKQHRKQINDLKKQIIAAKDELQEAISHGEAQVRGVLKRKADDEKGWRRRLGEAESRLADMEQQTSKFEPHFDLLADRAIGRTT